MQMAPMMSSVAQDWQTPPALFRAVEEWAGGFDLDAAATASASLCPRYFGPDHADPVCRDALTRGWLTCPPPTNVWLNPPYGRMLPKFVAKAVEEVSNDELISVWLLIPARVDTRWWNLLMSRAVEVRFLAGRVKFLRGELPAESAPFPSAVVEIHRAGGNPSVVWGWRP